MSIDAKRACNPRMSAVTIVPLNGTVLARMELLGYHEYHSIRHQSVSRTLEIDFRHRRNKEMKRTESLCVRTKDLLTKLRHHLERSYVRMPNV
jgi:hypothetical protein